MEKGLVVKVELSLPAPSSLDKRADWERLSEGLRGAVESALPVEFDLGLLRSLPCALRETGFCPKVTVAFLPDRLKVIEIGGSDPYGIAIDVGTTNLVGSLYRLTTLEFLGSMELENPQTEAALDVLTRTQLSMAGKGDELHRMLVDGVNRLIGELLDGRGLAKNDVAAVTIAGNTVMAHFLLGLPVDTIPMEPYIPVIHQPGFVNPEAIGLNVHPRAAVFVFPNVGSYVGGDIIAGIVASGMHRLSDPSLLVDVGTNAEIVLGCDEWIVVGAGAAGPALEGGISDIGMRALPGAVHSVEIGDDGEVRLWTIDDEEPEGLCGTGMIELVAELYRQGIIDSQGRFREGASGVVDEEDQKGFLIYDGRRGRLVVKATDIDNFLRSKAAMFSSLRVISTSVGVAFADIGRVFISGAFGRGINAEKAKSIGMIPDFDAARLIPLGNSSLKGAELVLTDRDLLGDIDRICSTVTYREMNTDGEFMREFPGALFIPHTNPVLLK